MLHKKSGISDKCFLVVPIAICDYLRVFDYQEGFLSCQACLTFRYHGCSVSCSSDYEVNLWTWWILRMLDSSLHQCDIIVSELIAL